MEWYVGVPECSVLGSILCLLCITDIPNDDNSTIDMFVDDTVILSKWMNRLIATDS